MSANPSLAASRNREIDWLRAYAVIAVILTHCTIIFPSPAVASEILGRFFNGGTGVDLFFVISGFVISQSFINSFDRAALAAKQGERGASLRAALRFFWRRLKRLCPAAYVWAVLVFLMMLNKGEPDFSQTLALKKLAANLLYLANFYEARVQTVFGYFWSLSVEMQFYFLLPAFLLLFKTAASRILALILLYILLSFWSPGGGDWWVFRFLGIPLGIVIFLLSTRPGNKPLPPAGTFTAMLLTALALLIMVIAPVHIKQPAQLGYSLATLAGGLLVWLAAQQRNYIAAFGMPGLLDWIGARSYSMYLCHIPMMLVARRVSFQLVGDSSGWGSKEIALVGVLTLIGIALASALTYRWLELPFMRGKAKSAPQAAFSS